METLIPYFGRKNHEIPYERERLELMDGDFLDLDWVKNKSKRLMIVSHGFEGNSRDHFIMELAKHVEDADLLVWHYRSCSGELNRLPRFYHQGDIEDLDEVINHARQAGAYDQIYLIGFSMGGNLVINYLGSDLSQNHITRGVAFSTPMDLAAASVTYSAKIGFFKKSFTGKFRKKIRGKAAMFPEHADLDRLDKITDLEELISEFVLPHHGFSSVDEFYKRWSSLQFIPDIKVPLLIVNAKNDPFLSKNCFPYAPCESSRHVYLETPKYGGHIGFAKKVNGKPWYVHRIEKFIGE